MKRSRPMTVDKAEKLAAAQLRRGIQALLDRTPPLDREDKTALAAKLVAWWAELAEEEETALFVKAGVY